MDTVHSYNGILNSSKKREQDQNNNANIYRLDSMHFKYCTGNVSFNLHNNPMR